MSNHDITKFPSVYDSNLMAYGYFFNFFFNCDLFIAISGCWWYRRTSCPSETAASATSSSQLSCANRRAKRHNRGVSVA